MIDIVLPVHNALEYTKECVRTLYEFTSDFRLIIIDDFSDETCREWLYGPECHGRNPRGLYVRTGKQFWFTRAANTGLRLVKTEWCVLINSDVILNSGWLDELYACRDEFLRVCPERKVGLVGDQGQDPGRRWVESVHPAYVTGHLWLCNMAAFQHMSEARGTPGRYLNEVDPGCIHIASDRIGCWELNKLGYATIACFNVPCGHHGGKSWDYRLDRVFGLKLSDVD